MRVIGGTARSIQLRAPAGLGTRPTTDRIKETLFNMLNPYLADCTFLDLFSGSGAIAIEALSRGAKSAVLVESSRNALVCINENLKKTRLTEKAEVISTDVFWGLKALEGQGRSFDLIFMDPPYKKQFEQRIFSYLKDSKLLSQQGLAVFETAIGSQIQFVEECNFTIEKIKEYKTNMHVFVKRGGWGDFPGGAPK